MTGKKIDGPSGPSTIELAQPLGGGAFGEVYAAVDTETGAQYAVKFPKSSVLGGEAETLAFKNDLMAAGKVKHPNVVEVVWASPETEPPYLVMERVTGGTLLGEIRRRAGTREQLSVDQVKRWFNDLINGAEAVNRVLLHRDIKPDNVLIADSALKLTDFGLAKIVDAATRSRTFKEAGAMAYLAPEAWLGESNEIQRDMYAVGLTMFEIATLDYALPLPAERGPERWKETHLYGRPKRLSECRSDLPAGVEQVLLRLVAKRPQDRFSSWGQVRSALDAAWTLAEPVRAQAGGQVDRIVRAVTASRVEHQSATAEKERAAQRSADVSKTTSFQWEQLLDDIEAALRPLQDVGSIALQRRGDDLVVVVDGKAVAEVSLIWIRPDHRFRNGTLTNAVASLTTACRKGFNAVLRRAGADDPYGKWEGVGWGRNALFFLGQTVEHKPEPFALDQEGLKRYLKILDGMTSDLQTDRVADVPDRFLTLLAECIEQMRPGSRR